MFQQLNLEILFDMILTVLSLFLAFDTINTWHSQTAILHELENRKSNTKFRSKVLLDKTLKLLDTRWKISLNAQTIICFIAALFIYLLAFFNAEDIAKWLSRIIAIVSLVFTISASKRNNRIVKKIRSEF